MCKKNLLTKQKKLMGGLGKIGPFIEGTLSTSYRICGNKGCRACASGAKHPAMFFTWKEEKATKSLYVPVSRWKEAKIYSSNYKKLKKTIRKLSDLQKKILKSD